MLSQSLVKDLQLLSYRINTILEEADPDAFEAFKRLNEALAKEPYHEAIQKIDPLLWEGRSIIFNRTTSRHIDNRDSRVAWTPLVAFGDFKKGDLRIHTLGSDMYYEPGTVIFLRGGILEHEVLEWEGPQRISIAHFTHKYIWEGHGVEHPV